MRNSKKRRIEERKKEKRQELVNRYNAAVNRLGKDSHIAKVWKSKIQELGMDD